MQVKAIQLGYYDNRRFREGQEFTLVARKIKDEKGKEKILSPQEQFSKVWMESLEPEVEEVVEGEQPAAKARGRVKN